MSLVSPMTFACKTGVYPEPIYLTCNQDSQENKNKMENTSVLKSNLFEFFGNKRIGTILIRFYEYFLIQETLLKYSNDIV